MEYKYDERIDNVSQEKKNAVESEISRVLRKYFDLSDGYLETIKFVMEDFFDENVAALVEPKNKIIFLDFYSFYNVIEQKYPRLSEEYRDVFNSILHEYIHLLNYYLDLKLYNQYIEKMDVSNYVKCSIQTLIDEYAATYKSGRIMYAKNSIHKILPSMCKYISEYKGKREIRLYWNVIQNLGIGIAHDVLVQEREGVSYYCQDVNKNEVVEYKDLILRIRQTLIEFQSSGKFVLLDALKDCVEELCGIFGMDKKYLKEIDNYANKIA